MEEKNQIERKEMRRLREFIQSLFEEIYPDRKPEDLSLLTVGKK